MADGLTQEGARRARREGASASRAGIGARYRAWLRHHRLSSADSLYRVLQHPVSSGLTWLVIGVALALPVGLHVLLDSAMQLSASLDGRAELSLFLEPGLDDAAVAALRAEIEAVDGVQGTAFLSNEEALHEFRELSGLGDVLESLERNPLPSLVLVEPLPTLDGAAVAALHGRLASLAGVTQAVVDLQWLQRLNTLMALAGRAVFAVGLVLVAGVVLTLGNTLRLAIENRRDEIVIIKLIGGSNAFVRRPFLYTGLWYGLGGGIAAALMVSMALWYLGQPVSALAELYQSDFRLQWRGVIGALEVILIGGALGLAGAWLAVSRHLGEIEPR